MRCQEAPPALVYRPRPSPAPRLERPGRGGSGARGPAAALPAARPYLLPVVSGQLGLGEEPDGGLGRRPEAQLPLGRNRQRSQQGSQQQPRRAARHAAAGRPRRDATGRDGTGGGPGPAPPPAAAGATLGPAWPLRPGPPGPRRGADSAPGASVAWLNVSTWEEFKAN